MRPLIPRLLLLLLPLALIGCQVRLNNAARLIARPDFPQAARAAPEWTRDALRTINQLEYELERR